MKFIMIALMLFSPVVFAKEAKVIDVKVTEKGFEPSSIEVKPGTQVSLKITRETDATCAKSVQVPSKKLKKELPLNKAVILELGALDKGEIRFACGMNMIEGKVLVR